jgi:uncharacterized protein (TIGR02186 family)
MKGKALLALLLLLAGTSAHAEKLTVALSTPEIQINSNFTGTNVTIFGVIERDAGTVARVAPYEVAALILGPPETVVARRKDRFLGIWINGASAGKYLRGDQLRALLALLVLGVAIRFGLGLVLAPSDPFSMAVLTAAGAQ